MGSATAASTCAFCGGRRSAADVECTGCGARPEGVATRTETTARLLEMSTQVNRLLQRTVSAERTARHRLRLGVGLVVATFVSLVVLSNVFVRLADSSPTMHAHDSPGAARSAVEERRREVAYRMMLDQGVFEEPR